MTTTCTFVRYGISALVDMKCKICNNFIHTCYQNDQFPGIEFLPPRCDIVHEVGVGGVQTFLVLVGEGAVILQDLVVHLL